MAVHKWMLTAADEGISVVSLDFSSRHIGGRLPGWTVRKTRLRGGLSEGVDVVHVDNGRLSFSVLPTRGMGLWKAWLDGEEIGWQSPVRGPVHPQFVPLMEPSGLGWLDGFDELLVRCGLESNGAPDFDQQGRLRYPLHGRIANRPARRVEVEVDDESGEIAVTGVVEETRFLCWNLRMTSRISTRLGESHLRIRDEVENVSASPTEVQLLYHINFGKPLLDADSRFLAAFQKMMPRDARAAEGVAAWDVYGPESAGFAEQVYFLQLVPDAQGWSPTLLKNAAGTRGVGVHMNTKQLPCFTLWKNTGAAADGYVTGLEPGTNFPNPRTYEGRQGRVVKLDAGGSAVFQVGLEIHDGAEQVQKAEQAIAALQAGVTPQVCQRPQAPWCVV
ncbi:MAG TPA: aldose 1-epimerase family protein [Candidatus Anammoximicrobium sp.]|nr:aldose 1-epimerase family protein [Candidatus Anammoximicrobium sp.]